MSAADTSPVKLTPELLIETYNRDRPSECPEVTALTDSRKKKYAEYIKQFPLLVDWRTAFGELHKSDLLRGLSQSPGHESFRASLDWLCTKGRSDGIENLVKVLEGKKSEINAILRSIMRKASQRDLAILDHQAGLDWRAYCATMDIPVPCFEASIDAKRTTGALKAVRIFIEQGARAGKCLVLCGPTGIGKTYAAVAGLRAWPGNSRRFLYFPSLCRDLYRFDAKTIAMDKAMHVRFLVLDDIGAGPTGNPAGFPADVDEIMTYREAKRFPNRPDVQSQARGPITAVFR